VGRGAALLAAAALGGVVVHVARDRGTTVGPDPSGTSAQDHPQDPPAGPSPAAPRDASPQETAGPKVPPPSGSIGRLDPSGAFFYPAWAGTTQAGEGGVASDTVVAETSLGPITAERYEHYLAAGYGKRHLDDMVFDILLAAECKARRIAGSAVVLARGNASLRLRESGRTEQDDLEGGLRQRFANDALRSMRIDALVMAARQEDPAQLKAVFDHRYGVDGIAVRVRHVLVSLARTAERTGLPEDSPECAAAAAQAIADLERRRRAGAPWSELLAASDDRTARRMLRDPETAGEAGFLPRYNYDRFGPDFASTVRGLEVGEVGVTSSPVGYHLVQVVERTVTRFEDVEDEVRTELRSRPVTEPAAAALRRALFEGYGYTPVGSDKE